MAYNLIFVDSQSLGLGATQAVITSTNQNPNAFMPDVGPRNYTDYSPNFTDLIPLYEFNNLAVAGGESPNSAITKAIMAYDSTYKMIFTNPGKGATRTQYRQRPGVIDASQNVIYPNYLRVVNLIRKIAISKGWGVPVPAFVVAIGGEDDNKFGVADLAARLQTQHNDLKIDFLNTFGTNSFNTIINQTSSHNTYHTLTYPSSALQQLAAIEAADLANASNPDLIFSCPNYCLPHAVDKTHLTGIGYQMLGEYKAKAMIARLQGGVFYGVRPKTVTKIAGDTIDVLFRVPVGPLVINTTVVPSHPNGFYGFEVWSTTAGANKTISSVTIVNDYNSTLHTQTVRIVLSASTSDVLRVRNAYTATVGVKPGLSGSSMSNLCDSDTTVGALSGATLPNFCAHMDTLVS